MVAVADRHVAEVPDIGARQDFAVALAQAAAQLVLVGENAILGEPAEFDVPVEHHHLMSLLGHDVGDGQPGWSGTDDDKQMFRAHPKSLCARDTLPRQKISAEASIPKKELSKRLSPRAPWLAAGQARFGHAPGIQEVGEALRRQDLLLQCDLPNRNASLAISAAASYPISGASAVHMAKLCSMPARHRSGLALRPSTQRTAKFSAARARSATDCRRLCAMTGSMTSNSKLPAWPDTMMAVSFPMTWTATIITDSAMTGLTLPGMMEEPGWVSGRRISPRPQRGPDPSHRMSLAIFIRLTATVRSAPLASTSASWAAWASKWFFASFIGQRVSRASNAITRLANSGWAFKPVPTAVPPKASSPKEERTRSTRWMPNSICRA